MTAELDTKALRAQYEAATHEPWYFDNVAEVVRPGPLADGTYPYAAVARGNTIAVNELIVTMRNTYAALLDRTEQADKYETALREISACMCRRGDTMGCPVAIARKALEELDAD